MEEGQPIVKLISAGMLTGTLVLIASTLTAAAPALAAGDYAKDIVGTSGNDNLRGTTKSDYIRARGGDDNVYARAGDDFLLGGPGRDYLDGQKGDEVLRPGGHPGKEARPDDRWRRRGHVLRRRRRHRHVRRSR